MTIPCNNCAFGPWGSLMSWRVKGDHNANSWHMRARVWVVCMRVRKAAAGNTTVILKGTSGDGDPYTLTLTIANTLLLPGNYSVRIEAQGFTTFTSNVSVS